MGEKNKKQKIYEDYENFMTIEDIAEKYGNSLAFIRLMIMTSRNKFYAKAKAWDNYLTDVESSIREFTSNEDEIKWHVDYAINEYMEDK